MNSRVALLTGIALAVLLSACSGKKDQDKPASQTAAKVNKEEVTVHQINAMLQQQRGLKPEQADEAGRQVLERLIDQELRLQKADELKIHRDPQVVQAIENARREIVARAYLERIGEGAAKPTPAEIKAYYDANPALFKERRIYQLQELTIAAASEQISTLRSKLEAAKNINEFVDYLKANSFKFAANQAVRAAEQLPLATLPAVAALRDGQSIFSKTPAGAVVLVLAGSRPQPVDEQQAGKAIEQFLLNERKRKVVADDLSALRASAKIAYVGKFAASAPVSAEAAATATFDAKAMTEGLGLKAGAVAASGAEGADVAVKPASGVDAAAITKGLGLK